MSLLEWLKIWSKFYRIPLFCNTEYPLPQKLKFRQILGLWVFSVTEYPPPPPENWNLGRSWDFEYFQLQNSPPPPSPWKLKFRQILGLWVFSVTEYPPTPPPPPTPKLKFRQILGLWVFPVTEYPPPAPPPDLPNGKLCVVSYHMWRLYPTRITTRFGWWR